MLKRYCFLLLFLLTLCGAKAQEPLRWESWLDADYGRRVEGSSTVAEVDVTFPLDGCAPGLHFLNFRAVNSAGQVGPLFRTLFYLPPAPFADVRLSAYEQWLDDDYAARTVRTDTATRPFFAADVRSLTPGLHYFNVRAVNTANEVGPLFRTLFYLPPARLADDALTGYEQWFDDDYEHRLSLASSSAEPVFTLDVSELAPGLHFLNIWAQNRAGATGSLFRTLFYLADRSWPDVAEYEYWLDNDTLAKVTGTDNRAEYAFTLDVGGLSPGEHTFSFRARNSAGTWSPLHVETFDLSETTPVEVLEADNRPFDVYNLAGIRVLTRATPADLRRLPASIYIIRGRKVLIR